jgi:hypothetical protein
VTVRRDLLPDEEQSDDLGVPLEGILKGAFWGTLLWAFIALILFCFGGPVA